MNMIVLKYPRFYFMTTQESLRKRIFGISPGDKGDNNGNHNVILDTLVPLYDEYYASCSPSLHSISAVLGIRSLDPQMTDMRVNEVPIVLDEIFARGMGVLEYVQNNLIDKTTFDPQFAVLALEAMCKQHKLNNFRTPTGHGHDIVYSIKPFSDDRYGFDNDLYIPATVGYYGIVGKSGAR